MSSGMSTSENGKNVKPHDDEAASGGGLAPPNCAGSGSAIDRIRTYVRRRWKRNEILAWRKCREVGRIGTRFYRAPIPYPDPPVAHGTGRNGWKPRVGER